MLRFDPSDPFPLIDLDSVPYSDQQEHSLKADQWLKMKTVEVETDLANRNSLEAERPRGDKYWIGLPVEALLTPYVELRFILEKLAFSGDGLAVDLGAGYGRMGFVIARHFPRLRFLGIEVVPERVWEGAAALAAFSNVQLIQGDLTASDFTLPEADVYFIYDYGSASAIEKTLSDLRELSSRRRFIVVGRGGATRDAIEKRHAWLSQVQEAQHFAHFSIYRS